MCLYHNIKREGDVRGMRSVCVSLDQHKYGRAESHARPRAENLGPGKGV